MRNRGISIAVAAVSAAQVAPLVTPVGTPVLPAAFAQDNNNPAPAPGEEDDGSNAPAPTDKAPEDMPNLRFHRSVLSGRAFEVTERGKVTGTDLPAVDPGTYVYMQWMDEDGSISPYCAAKVSDGIHGDNEQAGPGLYAFDLRTPFVGGCPIVCVRGVGLQVVRESVGVRHG